MQWEICVPAEYKACVVYCSQVFSELQYSVKLKYVVHTAVYNKETYIAH